MVTVEVANTNRQPCEVVIAWHDSAPSKGWTDGNGHISFDVSGGRGSVYVDGHEVLSDIEIYGTIQVTKR